MNRYHVLIAGGGIGGLTAAIALARRGHKVTLFEKEASLSEVGAGIQLSPNCTRLMSALDLGDAIHEIAMEPEQILVRHWQTGKVIHRSQLGDRATAQFGAPYYHVHRGDLIDALHEAASSYDEITIHRQTAVESFSQHDKDVEVHTSSGTVSGDLLVGADGIHSVVQQTLWGELRPRFTGNVAWRMLVPSGDVSPELSRSSAVWWGPGRHFVHYPVRHGQVVNCVGVVEKSGWEIESWTEQGERQEMIEDYVGWHDQVTELIRAGSSSRLYRWALFDRSPMAQWGKQRVTLLGDACHATLPFLAQGAAMAIEDAAVLAVCLEGEEVVTGLQRYEKLRKARTASIQRNSRRNATVFHLSGPAAWLRNRAAGVASRRLFDDVYGYDALNL